MSSVEPQLLADSRPDGHERPARVDEPLRLVHHHPGYLRIRAAELARPGDDSVVAGARAAAEAVPGFRSWSHDPRTGSAVVEYDPTASEADDVLNHIASRAGFRGIETATSQRSDRQSLVGVFLDTVQEVNQVVGELAAERADLRELVPVALAVTSVVSFVLNDERGRLPQWSNAAYHSYRVFMHWHRREIRGREKVALQREDRDIADRKRGDVR